MTDLTKLDRNNVRDALVRLRDARQSSDYRQQWLPTDADVRDAMRDAQFVISQTGQG